MRQRLQNLHVLIWCAPQMWHGCCHMLVGVRLSCCDRWPSIKASGFEVWSLLPWVASDYLVWRHLVALGSVLLGKGDSVFECMCSVAA